MEVRGGGPGGDIAVTAVAFVCFGEGGGRQEAKVTGGEVLTSNRQRVKEWRGSLCLDAGATVEEGQGGLETVG